jgi:hypothetical protein
MRYPKDPSAQIATGLAQLQMPEECEKNLLHNLLAILTVDPDCPDVGKEPASMLIKEGHDFQLKGRWSRCRTVAVERPQRVGLDQI